MAEKIYIMTPPEDDGTPVDWSVFDEPLPLETPRDPREIEIEKEFERRVAETS